MKSERLNQVCCEMQLNDHKRCECLGGYFIQHVSQRLAFCDQVCDPVLEKFLENKRYDLCLK